MFIAKYYLYLLSFCDDLAVTERGTFDVVLEELCTLGSLLYTFSVPTRGAILAVSSSSPKLTFILKDRLCNCFAVSPLLRIYRTDYLLELNLSISDFVRSAVLGVSTVSLPTEPLAS